MRRLVVSLLAAFAGCGPRLQPQPADGGEPLLPAACRLNGLPASLSTVEGRRLVIPLEPEPADARLSVAAGFDDRTRIEESPKRLVVRVPDGLAGTYSLRLRVECGSTSAEHGIDVSVAPLTWERASTWTEGVDGPLGREYASMWIDSGNPDRLLLFGGFHYQPRQFTPAWDLWEMDIPTGAWKQLTPTNEPPHQPGGRAVQVPGTREVLYLGGLNEALSDTPYSLKRFAYAPEELRWTDERLESGEGMGDYQPGFVYDSKRERYLSLCGASYTHGYHCRVRSYTPGATGGRWEDVEVAEPGPEGRNGHFFAYDPETDRVLVFAGNGETRILQDTWALELSESPARWVRLFGRLDPPLGRRNGAFALDPEDHRLIVWGGTPNGMTAFPHLHVLELDRGYERWEEVVIEGAPPSRSSGMAVYDAKRRQMLMGFGNAGPVYPDLWRLKL